MPLLKHTLFCRTEKVLRTQRMATKESPVMIEKSKDC